MVQFFGPPCKYKMVCTCLNHGPPVGECCPPVGAIPGAAPAGQWIENWILMEWNF